MSRLPVATDFDPLAELPDLPEDLVALGLDGFLAELTKEWEDRYRAVDEVDAAPARRTSSRASASSWSS